MGHDGETESNTFSLQLEDLGLAASSTQDTYQYAHDEDNTSVEIVGESDVISGVGDFETIVYNSDGDQVESTTGQLDSNAEVRSEFDLKAGNYTAEVVHIDSGITASTGMFTVEQLEELDTSVSFTENQFAQERGDVLSTDISLTNAESISSVQLNVSSDYAAGITVDTSDYDGDEITVFWNTYNAGTPGAGDRFWAVDEDGNELDVTIDGETDIGSNDLPATTYAANLYHNDADRQNRDDSATFNVEERHTGEEAATHIAPAEEYDSSDLEAILDDTTEFDQVATDDILVQSFEVSGVFGQATDVNGVDANAIVGGDTNGIHLNYTSTLDPSFEDPAMFNQSNANVEFVADAENNTIYAVVDTGSVAELAESEDEFEHAWETEFKVSDDYDLASSDETAATSFETVKRSAELDLVESPYQVTPTEDAEIRGTTTLAPGSTVNVEVNMPGVFLHDEDVDIVLEDGELLFNYTNDYSDRSIGEEFEITVDDNNGGDSTTDGIFAETPEWESTESNEELAALLDQHNVSSVEELNMLIAGLEDENGKPHRRGRRTRRGERKPLG